MNSLIGALAFVLFAPILGGLLAGFDRIVTARLQGRVGPPVLQPFYDTLKLLRKRASLVNYHQSFYIGGFLLFVIFTGMLFFAGGNVLVAIFAFTVAGVFLVMAAYASHSPYGTIGAERELLQMMAYEPMLLIVALGMYLVSRSFDASVIAHSPRALMVYLPGIFLGLLFILTIKFRKSPFDLSTSHHGHQELVKGLTTDFAGPDLAMVEIAHWYENIFLLGLVWLFFAPLHWAVALAATLAVYLLEILVDNTCARLKWQTALKSSWAVAAVLGTVNLVALEWMLK